MSTPSLGRTAFRPLPPCGARCGPSGTVHAGTTCQFGRSASLRRDCEFSFRSVFASSANRSSGPRTKVLHSRILGNPSAIGYLRPTTSGTKQAAVVWPAGTCVACQRSGIRQNVKCECDLGRGRHSAGLVVTTGNSPELKCWKYLQKNVIIVCKWHVDCYSARSRTCLPTVIILLQIAETYIVTNRRFRTVLAYS